MEERKKEYTILLLGETGVGKSMWINAIRNYVEYETFEEAVSEGPKFLIPLRSIHTSPMGTTREIRLGKPDNNERRETGKSATKLPRTYVLEQENYIINLIDTPGIGDTGLKDKINMKAILSHLIGFKEIHAICILLKPDETRLNTWFNYCTKEILRNLHKDAVQNFKFCFTRTKATNYRPGQTSVILKKLLNELKIDLLETQDSFKRNTFYFDNEAFLCLALKKNGIEVTEQDEKLYGLSWDQSVKETFRLFGEIMNLNSHSTERTISLNRARDLVVKISKPLAMVTEKIDLTIDRLDGLRKEAADLDLETKELSSDLYLTVSFVKKKEIKKPKTVCTHKECVTKKTNERGKTETCYEQVCCDSCTLGVIGVSPGTKNDWRLRFCWRMYSLKKEGNCSICKHSYKDHMHITYDYETFEKTISNEENRELLQQKESLLQKNNDILDKQGALLDELEHERDCIILAIVNFTIFLENNSILPYNDSFVEHIKLLIHEELDGEGNHGELKRLQKLKQEYEQKRHEIKKALANVDNNINADGVTAEKIFKIETNLYKLKHYGGSIESFMDLKKPPQPESIVKRFIAKVWRVLSNTTSRQS